MTRTHCKKGHDLSASGTYRDGKHGWRCAQCMKENDERRRERLREQKARAIAAGVTIEQRAEQTESAYARLREQVEALRGRAREWVVADEDRHPLPEISYDIVRDLAALPTEPDGAKADSGGVAVLRRLREWVIGQRDVSLATANAMDPESSATHESDATVLFNVACEIDRLLAEAESQPEGEARMDAIRAHDSEHILGEIANVLQRLACIGNGDDPGNSDGNMIALNALRDYCGVAWDAVAWKWVNLNAAGVPEDDADNPNGPARPMPTETFSEDEPEREGDDVLREFLRWSEEDWHDGELDSGLLAMQVLAKRALEGR